MHAPEVLLSAARVLVGAAALVAMMQVWRGRELDARSDGRWRYFLVLTGLGILALVHLAGAMSAREGGWAEVCTLIGTACLVCGLAARDRSMREAVSERMQAEGRLASQRRLLQTAFDAIPHVMAVKDAEARLLTVNRAFCELTGADPDTIEGKRVADVPSIAREDAAPVDPEDQLLLSGAQDVVESERQHATLDGGLRDYHVIKVPLRDEQGELDGLVVVGLDVTQRKAAERALADNQRLLREVFDAIPLLLAVKDMDGRYLMLNKCYTDTFGVSQEEVLGLVPTELPGRPAQEMAQVVADDRQVLCGESKRHTSERWRRDRAGGIRLVETVRSALHNARGELSGVVSLGTDITERRRIEDELSMYRDRLQERVAERTRELELAQQELVRSERLAAIGRLTATVSHELRNPLGTITASHHMVRRLIGTPGPRLAAVMDRIERNIARCVKKIVEDLLDYAREPSIAREPTDVDRWLAEFCAELSIPSGITMNVVLEARTCVDMDRSRVRQALVNLVQNACQSMLDDQSGDLAAAEATLEVASALHDGNVAISVRDSGPGIPDDVMAQIFEPLFSTRSFGIGLGLPLVKQIAEGHGGGIELHSTPGQGTVATFWMPA